MSPPYPLPRYHALSRGPWGDLGAIVVYSGYPAGGIDPQRRLSRPSGISKPLTEEDQQKFIAGAEHAVKFGLFSLELFNDVVLKNEEYVNTIVSDTYTHRTYYMGLVDKNNKVNFYDGKLRVVDPDGKEYVK
ncbi:MAG: hypothetical protein J3T61_05900, partial [Candidatus Brocadiales bacterium]|nr:hypothetical protein [Candidatus Bathyanammoxibius sp.]